MAGKNYEIKTSLAIDGEQKFRQAIEDATRSMKVMDSEMRKAKAAYQAGGDGVDYFNAKSEALSGKVKQQEAIVKALEQAVEESAKTYGEASKQADTYRIKLNQAEATLIKMKKASKDADKEAEELGRDAKKVGQQISDGIGEGAETAANETESAFDRIKGKLDEIRNSVAVQTAMQVGGFVVDTIGNAMGFVEENAELSRQIAIARFNIERYGFSWDEVDNLIVQAAAITGDHEGAMAALSSIVQYGFDDIGMMEAAVDAILGGILSRPGLSIESLAEDILNTINTGEASGSYAELVSEVLGVAATDEINAALENAQSREEAAQIALSYLTQGGLQTLTENFENQNAELIRYQTAALEMNQTWNELSQTIRPLVSGLLETIKYWIDTLNSFLEESQFLEDIERYTQEGMTPREAITRARSDRWARRLPETAETVQETFQEGGNLWDAFTNVTFGEAWRDMWNWILPSAGAEEMPVGWEEYAANARTQMENELANSEGAHNAGTEMINQFGQGIEEGTAAPIAAVQNMVNQINSLLSGVGGGAYSLGLAGVSGVSLVVDGQELGRAVAGGVSSTLGRRVATRMYAD